MKNRQFIESNNDSLKDIVDDFLSSRHNFNNYFGIEFTDVEYLVEGDNLFIIKKFSNFNRLYIVANDISVIVEVLNIIPNNTVINIPSKTGIENWEKFFKDAKIEPLAKYRRFNYINYRKGNNKNIEYAKIGDSQIINEQLNDFFSPLTGHLPSIAELGRMIQDETILVNRNEYNEVSGALSCQISGKKADLTFWYDYAGDGLKLLFNVFFLCHEKGIRIITFWVNEENIDTIGIHEMLGAKRDGLIDYIYLKR